MTFEIGKYYEHTTGSRLFIAGCMSSCVYGLCLIGENEFGEFSAIGRGEDDAINYAEITKEQFISLSPSANGFEYKDRLHGLMQDIVCSLLKETPSPILVSKHIHGRAINNKAELDYYKANCADDHKEDERDYFQAQRQCRETLVECAKKLADKDFEKSKM